MMIDVQSQPICGPAMTRPDFPFAADPKPRALIKEVVIIAGTTSDRTVSVKGTADDREPR